MAELKEQTVAMGEGSGSSAFGVELTWGFELEGS